MPEKLMSSQLVAFGEGGPPPGTYLAKLAKIDTKQSTKGENTTHYLSMQVEYLQGEAEGLTSTITIFPKVTRSEKDGKLYGRDLYKAMTFAQKWGSPLPDFSLDEFFGGTTPKGARLLQRLMGESFQKAGQPRIKVRIVPEPIQEKDASGKWVDAHDETGELRIINRAYIVGRAEESAPAGTLIATNGDDVAPPADVAEVGASMSFV